MLKWTYGAWSGTIRQASSFEFVQSRQRINNVMDSNQTTGTPVVIGEGQILFSSKDRC